MNFNVDGSPNKAGSLTEWCQLEIWAGDYCEKVNFLVTNLGSEDIILGLPWLRKINPTIDWEHGTVEISCGAGHIAPLPCYYPYQPLENPTEEVTGVGIGADAVQRAQEHCNGCVQRLERNTRRYKEISNRDKLYINSL